MKQFIIKGISSAISPLPRVPGLGIILEAVSNLFSSDKYLIEKTVFGSKMRLRTNDLIGRFLIFTPNYYDRKERKAISAIVQSGDMVVDVGANIGVYTLFLSRLVGPQGKVIAIEAESFNASELIKNIALNGYENVSVHQVGASNKNEALDLMLNTTGNAGGHSFHDQAHISEPQTEQITCVPLSSVVPERACKFMKLDIEGFEHRVLARFFEDVAADFWPIYIMLESNPERQEKNPVTVCLSNGYEVIDQIDYNILLRRSH